MKGIINMYKFDAVLKINNEEFKLKQIPYNDLVELIKLLAMLKAIENLECEERND